MKTNLTNIVAVGCLGLLLQGCSRSKASPTAPTPGTSQSAAVQSVQIGGGAAGAPLTVGQQVQLKAVARLRDGSEQDVTSFAAWASDNPSVATVSSSGVVTGVGAGSGRVRAIYQTASGETSFDVEDNRAGSGQNPPAASPGSPTDGGTSPGDSSGGGSTPAPAPAPGPIPPPGGSVTVQSLTITGDHNVPVGRNAQLRAIAHMSDGSQKDVTADSNWSSDNSLIGAISQSGILTGVAPGSNVVTANYNGTSASQPVQVTPF